MELHFPTLFAMIAVGSLMLAVMLAVAQKGPLRQDRAVGDWSRGVWAMATGYLALFARDAMPAALSSLIGNLGTELALAYFAAAFHRFLFGSAPPRWLWVLLAIQVLLLTLVLAQPYPVRVGWVSLSHALLTLPSLWWLHRARPFPERLMQGVYLTLGVAELVLLFRVVDVTLHPDLYQGIFQGGMRQGITFVVAYLFLLISGFGFALANMERGVRQLQQLAHTDPLTGCLNRRAADELMECSLHDSQRGGRPFAFVLLDLDHFKRVNDRHGHRIGDLALQRFADTVRALLEQDQWLARLGGEEFGLLLPDCDAAEARRSAEKIREAVESMQLRDEDGQAVPLTVSAGVAATAVSAAPPGAEGRHLSRLLYARADKALYRAKSLGRNRVNCADAEVAVTAATA